MKKSKLITFIVFIVIILSILSLYSCEKSRCTINYIETEYVAYNVAMYEQNTEYEDEDEYGNIVTKTDTETWSEECSELYELQTYNGNVMYLTKGAFIVSDIYTNQPTNYNTYSKNKYFDYFKAEKQLKLTITLNTGDKYEVFNDNKLYVYYKSHNFEPNTEVIITRVLGGISSVDIPDEK